MRLLLTSAGIQNAEIGNAIVRLVKKPVSDIKIVFIPTAATEWAAWIEEDVKHFQEFGFKSLEIVDISKMSKDKWLPYFEAADLLCFGGGSEFRLMHYVQESGLGTILHELMKTKVYMGISAGSMIACPTLFVDVSHRLYNESTDLTSNVKGFGFVNFQFFPHLNSAFFPITEKTATEWAEKSLLPTYATDDMTAIEVNNGIVTVVGTGVHIEVNV